MAQMPIHLSLCCFFACVVLNDPPSLLNLCSSSRPGSCLAALSKSFLCCVSVALCASAVPRCMCALLFTLCPLPVSTATNHPFAPAIHFAFGLCRSLLSLPCLSNSPLSSVYFVLNHHAAWSWAR